MRAVVAGGPLRLSEISNYVFFGPSRQRVELDPESRGRVRASHRAFLNELEKRGPIYGVTTGFGESCHRRVSIENAEALQKNLISYLSCGSGKWLGLPVRRAMMLFRLQSLSRGLSGVSEELVERLHFYVESDWVPPVPSEGSLGASGDLIPLAYLAGAIQGWGEVETPMGTRNTSDLLSEFAKSPYCLKPKEGLALVNGTSTMAAQCYVNLVEAQLLVRLAVLESAWLCLAINGRREPFGPLVNAQAKSNCGQRAVAEGIERLLRDEDYHSRDSEGHGEIQDRYSLRCAPQILGPIRETLQQVTRWVEIDANGVSDNPLVSEAGELQSGGNFYGGYLSHGMDYLKISLAHMADMLDRQIALVIDDRANRGLPPNLANWPGLAVEERMMHHGLKGLHQAISAITSDVVSRAIPSGIFSRSSESHNQDKVSLGLTAAMACESQLESLYRIHAMGLICLAQALDLRGIRLKGIESRQWLDKIRSVVPFVERDKPLDRGIVALAELLRNESHRQGECLVEK